MRRYISILFMLFLIAGVYGCVDSSTATLPDKTAPIIFVYKPASNDTVIVGKREVLYDASDDQGIAYYEVYVNDKVHERFYTKSDGTRPQIFLNLDSTFLNKRIKYYITAYDKGNNSTKSAEMANILVSVSRTPPVAPKSLVLTKLSNTKINLTWKDSSNNESAFEVWKKEEGKQYYKLKTLAPNTVSTNDSGLNVAVKYSYKVRAINIYGFSESNEVSTSPVGGLQAPSNLQAQSLSSKKIKLTWNDNSTDELYFKIERKPVWSSEYEQLAIVDQNATSYLDEKELVGGSTYSYRISAFGPFGQSGYSNEAVVTTLTFDFYAPSNLSGSYDKDKKRVVLTWSDNSIYESETRIERRAPGLLTPGTWMEIGKVKADITNYADTTVYTGAVYIYRVRGYSTSGIFSDYSNEFQIMIPNPVQKIVTNIK